MISYGVHLVCDLIDYKVTDQRVLVMSIRAVFFLCFMMIVFVSSPCLLPIIFRNLLFPAAIPSPRHDSQLIDG